MRHVVLPAVLSVLSILSSAQNKPQIANRYARLPLSFERNRGQASREVDFVAHGEDFTLGLAGGETYFAVPGGGSVVRLSVVGAKPVAATAGEMLPGKVNYLRGADESQWLRDVPTYASVGYKGLRPGVDLRFYGNQRQVEYDFVLAAGTSARELRMKVAGADGISLAKDGALVIRSSGRELKWHAPATYQLIDGKRRKVESRYRLMASNEFGFEVGAYDKTRPLVIDPVLGYATYVGGHGQDTVSDIAVDSQGHAFIAGQAGSVSFPTTSGSYRPTSPTGYEGFVSKLSIDGSRLLYSTFLQGAMPNGVAVDSSGNAYLTGSVFVGASFPVKNAYRSTPYGDVDAFLMKLNGSGSDLVYSTYFGGKSTDIGVSVAVFNGTAYVTGQTLSSDLPLQSAMQTSNGGDVDAFLARFSADGKSLIFSTYLGGGSTDIPTGLTTDASGNAYITGTTTSVDFPATEHIGSIESDGMGFVTKVSSSDSLDYSTTINGPSGVDANGFTPAGIAVDGGGAAYVAGNGGPGFPVSSGALNTSSRCGGQPCKIRVVKLNAAGDALVYSAAFGGSADDLAGDVAVDGSGHAFVTGYTFSTNFPLASPLQSQLNKGVLNSCSDPEGGPFNCNDAFVSELNLAGSALLFSTYLGGTQRDQGVALKWWSGHLFVTGNTQSSDFPVTANAFQKQFSGSTDPWVARIDFGSSGSTGCVAQTDPGVKICSPVNGSTVPAGSVRIQSVTTSTSPVVATKVYIDGVVKYSTSSASVDFTTTLTVKGQRKLTVKSWTSSGVVLAKTIYFTIQ